MRAIVLLFGVVVFGSAISGGIMTEEDLAGYSVDWVEPLRFPIGAGRTVVTTPSPSGGPVVQFIINVLKSKTSS